MLEPRHSLISLYLSILSNAVLFKMLKAFLLLLFKYFKQLYISVLLICCS
jgi:hypothetical protein